MSHYPRIIDKTGIVGDENVKSFEIEKEAMIVEYYLKACYLKPLSCFHISLKSPTSLPTLLTLQ